MNAVRIATPKKDAQITMGEVRRLVQDADEIGVSDSETVHGYAATSPGSATTSLRVRIVRLAIE